MKRLDKLKFWLSTTVRVLLLGAAVFAVLGEQWIHVALSIVTFLFTFLPTLLERRFRIDFPNEFEILIILFLYGSIYLGEVQSFYFKFWWWDLFLHALSGLIIGIVGFSLVYLLNNEKRLGLQLSPGFIALFAFSFAVAIGGLWEIFEFGVDQSFGLQMQKSGLIDTMGDLIVDTFSAFFVSLSGYLYLKKDVQPFKRLEERFARER